MTYRQYVSRKTRPEVDRRIQEALKNKPTRGFIQNNRPLNVVPGFERRPPNLPHQNPVTPDSPVARPDTVLWTGGIGDVITIESFLTDEERASFRNFCYATRQHAPIRELFGSVPTYANVEHFIIWDDFTGFYCFTRKEEVVPKLPHVPQLFREASDFSIMVKFAQAARGDIAYNYSSFLRHTIANVARFELPPAYVTICPSTYARTFTGRDWQNVIKRLRHRRQAGVVLGTDDHVPPVDPQIVNLTGKTTLPEAIEILKGSRGYLGIDSSLSVLAAKLFSHDDIVVKSHNPHLFNNKYIYYAPYTQFKFIVGDM